MKCPSLCIIAVLVFALAQAPPGPEITGQTFRVQVEMVTLPVVVTDSTGVTVKNLKLEDFSVLEDGIPQQVAGFAAVEEPISAALMLDVSGSTSFELRRIQNEAIRFVNALRPADSIAILSVADEVRLLEQFSIYHKKDAEKIRHVQPGWLSAVYDGVWFALEKVLKLEDGRKALIFFSDGVDNRSQTATRADTMELARRTEAPIYSVYFNTDPNRDSPSNRRRSGLDYAAGREYMADIANCSGGLFLDVSRIEDLGPVFQKIAQDLSSQYSIGYYPKNLAYDGKLRRIEVRVGIPGLQARTKEGYYHVARP